MPLHPPCVSVHSLLSSFCQKQTLAEAHLEYNLRLYDEAQRSIVRALELGHVDDGTMQIQLARIHVRRHNVDTSNSRRDLTAALASFSEALKFKSIALTAVHYLEVRASHGSVWVGKLVTRVRLHNGVWVPCLITSTPPPARLLWCLPLCVAVCL